MPRLVLDETLKWLAPRLATLGCEFEVHEPPKLIDYLRALGARVIGATDTRSS
ncbi:WYL domain-containing protein [Plantactinospora alkalitolerans]|uniref:WYL domain-containing protein n=1 Tax=Plantactinospora alkalitolerans TaxID=2789879 RepID=UPI001E31DAA4|nr:WYL domain-containing protein [Plantactinospora alkalitolerans]